MTSPFLGEFLGTMIIVLLGNGVVAGVLLKQSKAEGSGWIVITAGWAFAVMAGVFVSIACGSNDAHLNPVVTMGFAVRDASFGKLAPYLAAQLLGAIVGAALVWLHYLPHWKETPDAAAKLACFCTAPAIRSFAANLFSEICATFVLVFVIGAIFSKRVSATGPAAGLGPYLVGSLVWGVGLITRRHDRLRHQSRARLRSAYRARRFAHRRKRKFGLGLLACPCDRSHSWWSIGGVASTRPCHFLIHR